MPFPAGGDEQRGQKRNGGGGGSGHNFFSQAQSGVQQAINNTVPSAPPPVSSNSSGQYSGGGGAPSAPSGGGSGSISGVGRPSQPSGPTQAQIERRALRAERHRKQAHRARKQERRANQRERRQERAERKKERIENRPPRLQEFLAGDDVFQSQISQLQKELENFMTSNRDQRGDVNESFQEALQRMGSERSRALEEMEADFASRGLLNSGLYTDAVGDYNKEYGTRRGDLQTDKSNSLEELIQSAGNFQTDTRGQREAARQEAIRRRAQQFGLTL